MNIQNQNELTERELKIKNNSPQNHKKLPIQVQRILCFQKKEDRFWSKMKFEPIFFCRAGGSDPFLVMLLAEQKA